MIGGMILIAICSRSSIITLIIIVESKHMLLLLSWWSLRTSTIIIMSTHRCPTVRGGGADTDIAWAVHSHRLMIFTPNSSI